MGSEAKLILTNSDGVVAEHAFHFLFEVINNQSEYEALLVGLRLSRELGVESLRIFTDSQLMVGQVTDEFEARDPMMAKYLDKVCTCIAGFWHFNISHIFREENACANTLSKLTILADSSLGQAFIEYLEALAS